MEPQWKNAMAGTIFFWSAGAVLSLLSLPILIIIALIIHLQYRIRKFAHIPSPKMKPHWSSYIFGHANQMDKVRTGEETIHERTLIWIRETGPVMVVHVISRSMILFATKESVKEFVTSGRHFKTPAVYQKLHTVLAERFLGNGLVVEHTDHIWAARRNLFNPAFHRSYLRLSMDQFNRSTNDLIRHMARKADGKTRVRMLDELSKVTMDVIAKVGFNFDCGSFTNEHSEFNGAVKTALKGYSFFLRNPWQKYSFKAETIAHKKKVQSSIKLLRQTGEQIVKDRIENMKKGETGSPNDILSYILKATNGLTDKSFGMTEVVDEFVTFFVAGMETSANTLSTVFLHLHQNKDVMERLQQEVKTVIGERTSIKFEDLGKLEYMGAVIKETLRATPPIGGTGRVSSNDVVVNGYLIPKGSEVIITVCIENMEEYFPDPNDFKPERFLQQTIEANTWVPFMVGPRSCIGQQFAMMEMKVILARLLQTFNFEWLPEQSTKITEETTMKLADGALHYIRLLDGVTVDE
ncbi:cholesterol 24-hydroxylase-like isoform X1 [Apostichopus japonicus]|uniref:cholesterol 24-hydroxylase-like isoform X1 n=2 Tax=Stichopus japonicus TaxID=307972 RepID=UPI003AB1BC45